MIVDVNECLGNPCQNGGTCLNTVGSFTCNCMAGYQGQTCANGIVDYIVKCGLFQPRYFSFIKTKSSLLCMILEPKTRGAYCCIQTVFATC